MLKNALRSRGGKQPDISIQDADSAMAGAVGRVFPDALPRRCLWHLNRSILKAFAKVLGREGFCLHGRFKCAREQVSLEKFEARFNALIDKYPQAEQYLRVTYNDRARWAKYVSPLVFSVGSWTASRGKGAFLRHLSCLYR
ncbi:unnamed protein product [Pylaiella littoralis]